MAQEAVSGADESARDALEAPALSAAANIPGTDFVSITMRRHVDETVRTVVATDRSASGLTRCSTSYVRVPATPLSPTTGSS